MICRFCKTDNVRPTNIALAKDELSKAFVSETVCTLCGAINAQVVEQVELDDFGIKESEDAQANDKTTKP